MPTIAARKESRRQVVDEDEDEDNGDVAAHEEGHEEGATGGTLNSEDSEEELAADPLAAKPKQKPKPKQSSKTTIPAKRKTSTRQQSPMSLSDRASPRSSPPPIALPPGPSQSSETPGIPQNLLIRLLHEQFKDKKTQIDKNAIQVLQKYMEVFVREAIARTALAKQERAEKGEMLVDDAKWLDLEDLESVAPGLVLDF
ncbi:hypothetical protein B0A50_04761 [Salinomyces thailandicus]|uniref:Centromere protein X n=1 Tax=Salinomyces thailandicus TaxID=706561 RepID=A0A4U0TW86_9PEZI|nr:hypothetical protein B0A50_04761 [Salinomyces thailandica]